MKRFLLSLAAITVLLVTGASAKDLNYPQKNQKRVINTNNVSYNKNALLTGTLDAVFPHYWFTYLGQAKNVSLIAYNNFVNMYDTLVCSKSNNKTTNYSLPTTIFNDVLFYDDDGNFDRLQYAHKLQYLFIQGTLYTLEAEGISTNITYTVQKKVGHSAVTITLNMPQILAKYASFLMYLKSLSNNNPQKFNEIFQKLAVFMYYNDGLTYYNPLVKITGKEPVKVISLTDKLVDDPFSPQDFIGMVLGGYRGYERAFLAKHKNIAKFINYILTDQKEKAARLFLDNKEVEYNKNLYFSILSATAKIEDSKVLLPNNYSKAVYKKSLDVLNKTPDKYKQNGLSVKEYIKGLAEIVKITLKERDKK